MKKIAVILLNYKAAEDTIKCVSMYRKQTGVAIQFIVVDNHSQDNSMSKFEQAFGNDPDVMILESGINGGFAFGNNLGIKQAEQLDINFILVSNSDIEIADTTLLMTLSNIYNTLKTPAIISPVMNENGRPSKVPAWKIPGISHDLVAASLFLKRLFGNSTTYPSSFFQSEHCPVDCLPGSFMFASRTLFKSIEYMDEGTFLYCEERILAQKIKRQNLQNYLITNLSYNHETSGTISKSHDFCSRMNILTQSKLYYHQNYGTKNGLLLTLLRIMSKLACLEYRFVRLFKKK